MRGECPTLSRGLTAIATFMSQYPLKRVVEFHTPTASLSRDWEEKSVLPDLTWGHRHCDVQSFKLLACQSSLITKSDKQYDKLSREHKDMWIPEDKEADDV